MTKLKEIKDLQTLLLDCTDQEFEEAGVAIRDMRRVFGLSKQRRDIHMQKKSDGSFKYDVIVTVDKDDKEI
jgi:hypothetical protein